MNDVPQCVLDLLTTLHGDGGKFLSERGLEAACEAGGEIVRRLRMDVAALQESHAILVSSEDPW